MGELRKVSVRERKNLKEIREEAIKATKFLNLHLSQEVELRRLNSRQKRYNERIELRRKAIKEKNIQKAKDIIDGRDIKIRREGIVKRIVADPYFLGFTIGSLIAYFLLSRVAYMERGYSAIGGEEIFLFAPIIIFIYKLVNEFA